MIETEIMQSDFIVLDNKTHPAHRPRDCRGSWRPGRSSHSFLRFKSSEDVFNVVETPVTQSSKEALMSEPPDPLGHSARKDRD